MTDLKGFDNVKTPFYAAVGAGDVVVQAVADVVAQVRERAATAGDDLTADAARERFDKLAGDVVDGVETLRERLAGWPSELPEELAELRERFTTEELRKVAEAYLKVASDIYTSLAERGEETVERLRKQPGVEEGLGRAESVLGDAAALTEEALGTVARQTRAVGEQAAKLAGRAAEKISDVADEVSDAVSDAGEQVASRFVGAGEKAEATTESAANKVAAAAPKATAKTEPVATESAAKTEPAATAEPAKAEPAKAAPAKAAPAKAAPVKAAAKPAAETKAAPAKAPAKKAPAPKATDA